MEYDKLWLICASVLIGITIICISLMVMSNSAYKIEFRMDPNTREYLVAHDYCMVTNTDNTFIGDCKYLDYNIIKQGE